MKRGRLRIIMEGETARNKLNVFLKVTVVLDVFVWDLERVFRGRMRGG